MIRKLVAIVLSLKLLACGLSPKTEADIGKVGAGILCVIEHVELDDPDLNKACDSILSQLPPPARAAVIRAGQERAAERQVVSTTRCAEHGK